MMCVLLVQPEIDYNKVLVVHNASSCTHPANYYHLMKTIVYPYWAADPPEHRLSKKNYKTVDHPTAWVQEDSLKFKVGYSGTIAPCSPVVKGPRMLRRDVGSKSPARAHSRLRVMF